MNQNTLVKIQNSEDFLIFHTYSRHSGSSPQFYISKKRFHRLTDSGSIYSRDRDNLAETCLICQPDGKMYVQIKFYWLTVFGDETISGRQEAIQLPLSVVFLILSAANETVHYVLSNEYTKCPPNIIQNRKKPALCGFQPHTSEKTGPLPDGTFLLRVYPESCSVR